MLAGHGDFMIALARRAGSPPLRPVDFVLRIRRDVEAARSRAIEDKGDHQGSGDNHPEQTSLHGFDVNAARSPLGRPEKGLNRYDPAWLKGDT